MRTKIDLFPDGRVSIRSRYNQYFIHHIDHEYARNQNEDYTPMLQDQVKLALFLSDQFDAAIGGHDKLTRRAEEHEEYDEFDSFKDPYEGVPDMGTQPVTQTVDISKIQSRTRIG